jgi:hypothetical protein
MHYAPITWVHICMTGQYAIGWHTDAIFGSIFGSANTRWAGTDAKYAAVRHGLPLQRYPSARDL